MTIRRFWKRFILVAFLLPVLVFSVTVSVIYLKQDDLVQHLLEDLNKDFQGNAEIRDSHISLFENFPYISIDLEDVKVFEDKAKETTPIVDVKEVYIGFDLWTVLNGKMEVKIIKLKNGSLNIVQHTDNEFNIVKALSSTHDIGDPNQEFHLDLKKIELERIDLTKLNESNNLLVDAYIYNAVSKFKTSPQHVFTALAARFELNIIVNNDTTFIKHKHFEVNTEIDFLQGKEILTLAPSVVKLEEAEFNMGGTIDFQNDMFLDLSFTGNKPDFELFIALAPEELIPSLKKYENKGKILFEATVKGKSINGNNPAIDARFGCEDAFFNNYTVNKKLDDLNFVGHFTNGEKRDITTMEFSIKDFSARPEVGKFSGNLHVKNFQSPEIDLQLTSEFELEFLAKFANLETLQDLHGKVSFSMNFKDIIDLEFPEKSIEKWNEAYFMQMKIENLSFFSTTYNLPIKDVDFFAEVTGQQAEIKYLNISIGKSDLSLHGAISDLPSILHHTSTPVTTTFSIKSNYLDLFELTGSDSLKSFDEQIENLSLDLELRSSARAFTESPHLPKGEFFINNLYAKLNHYPHTLHDFHADVYIEDEDLKVIDLKGMIDKSDFFFSGKLGHYDLWYAEHPEGDSKIEFNLVSNLLQLEDIFSYKGANYVPEDYRHEEFRNLKVHGYTDLHFKKGFQSFDLYVDKFDAKMKMHPMRFENINGRVHFEDDHLVVENFSGKIGKSDFRASLNYYVGQDEAIKKRDNHFELTSSRLDFDELFNYQPPPSSTTQKDHDAGFNIYELPFTDMTFNFKVDHLNYHRYLIDNLKTRMRTTPKHFLYVDELHLDAAGGSFDITGYFNGSDPKLIYLNPNMKIKNVDMDKLLLKFDNFGQDHIVSENLHGKLSGTITGKIHMHNDLVPKIDDSEIHMDIDVTNGRLENVVLFDYLSDYFRDKNLKKILFDTLANRLDLTNGVLTIPKMSINSSLGFMEISGKQDMNMNMEYYLRIPWKMVTQAASSKLFGKKAEEVDPDQVDAIQYSDPQKKIKYVNIKIVGTADDFEISLGKGISKGPK